jgi:Tn3 transposase DDE domain
VTGPALADLPDQKGWRISPSADYGPLIAFARGRIDLGRIRAHWHDILPARQQLRARVAPAGGGLGVGLAAPEVTDAA